MDFPRRKPARLREYDYSTPGAYFVTVCTHEKKCSLSTISVGAAIGRPPVDGVSVRLTAFGEIVDLAIRSIPTFYPQVSVDQYVIMPNHVHLILRIHTDENGRMISAPTLSTVVGQMKRWASKQAGESLRQKSFYEHVIRNEADYRRIWDYIDTNPAKWTEDCYYVSGQ